MNFDGQRKWNANAVHITICVSWQNGKDSFFLSLFLSLLACFACLFCLLFVSFICFVSFWRMAIPVVNEMLFSFLLLFFHSLSAFQVVHPHVSFLIIFNQYQLAKSEHDHLYDG